MDSENGAYCPKPFNHLLFLIAAICGGAFAFALAVAVTLSSGWGQCLLIVLIVIIGAGLFVNYWLHYKTYKRLRDPDLELWMAMIVQTFILVCWILFSLHVAVHTLHWPKLPAYIVTPPGITSAPPRG